VATTASYQASIEGFERAGMTRQESVELLRRSVDLAVAARTRVPTDDPLLVAASVGPHGATRGDGSEYTGDYDIGVAELRRFHRPRLEVLATAGADVLALETVPCLAEAFAMARGVAGVVAVGINRTPIDDPGPVTQRLSRRRYEDGWPPAWPGLAAFRADVVTGRRPLVVRLIQFAEETDRRGRG